MDDVAHAFLSDLVNLVRYLFTGPFAGVITAAITYFVLDVGVRRRRERRDVINAITAELELNVLELSRVLEHRPLALPRRSGISSLVFRSLSSRLGELEPLDIGVVVRAYAMFDQIDHLREMWATNRQEATDLPESTGRDKQLVRVSQGIDEYFQLVAEARELTGIAILALRGQATRANLKYVTEQTRRLDERST